MNHAKKAIEFIVFPFLLGVVSFTIYENIQPIIDYELCKLCDAVKYKKIYENFVNNTFESVDYPFYTRLLTPFIASILSKNDVIHGFHYTNLLFLVLTNVTLYYTWRKILRLNIGFCLIGLLWLNFHWTGIPRYYNLHVINVDTGIFFFQAVTVLILLKKKWKWFLIVVPLAVFQKESYTPIFLIITAYYIVSHVILKKNDYIFLVMSLLFSILLKIVSAKIYPTHSAETTLRYMYFQTLEVVDEPLLLTKILVCFFIGFACFSWIILMKFSVKDFNDEIKAICLLITLLHLLFPIIGGKDMTRIMFLGFPFTMTLALLALQECKTITKVVACLLSIPLMRISEVIPDFMKNSVNDAKWHLEVADYSEVAAWGMYAIFCYIVLHRLETSPKITTNVKYL